MKTVTYFQVIDLDDRYGPLKVFRTKKEAVDEKKSYHELDWPSIRIEPMTVEL